MASAEWVVKPTEAAGDGPHALAEPAAGSEIGSLGVYCAGDAAILTIGDFAGMTDTPLMARIVVDGRAFQATLPHYFAGSVMGEAPEGLVEALQRGLRAEVAVKGASGYFQLLGSSGAIAEALSNCAGPSATTARSAAALPEPVRAYAAARYGEAIDIRVFPGDFTGDGRADAVAFIYYPSGPNNFSLDVSLFEARDGRLAHRRRVQNVFGTEPRDVVIAPGRITVTTTTLAPGDPRCCPTGSTRYEFEP